MKIGIFIEIVTYLVNKTMHTTQKIEKIYIGEHILNQGSSGNHWIIEEKFCLLKQFQNMLLNSVENVVTPRV